LLEKLEHCSFNCCLTDFFYLTGAAVKPFGSFISKLHAKSGDLDVSVDLCNGSKLPISKKKKQNALRELMRALQIRGKPLLSFSFGIHCMFTIYP
jgi:DNA polymerase sigma